MLINLVGKKKTSDIALRCLISFGVASLLIAVMHSFLQGWHYGAGNEDRDRVIMLATFASDIRYFCDQIMYISAMIFIGAKFFETRTTFAVTFDRVDASKMSVKGPDGDNVVWIGQRYGTELEAQTVAATLENRLKENAA